MSPDRTYIHQHSEAHYYTADTIKPDSGQPEAMHC